jgi:glyoxylase-like metal-dependent hydrolase (beta-lactamase superfamily II)
VEWILETHAHADHLTAADWLKHSLDGIPRTGIGAGIVAVQQHFRDVFALDTDFAVDGSQFDRLFADGEQFRLGNLDIHVVATPGHTSDGLSYLIGDAVFVGDTLFAPPAGTGRCDFPGANAATQYRSIQRLYALPDATRVFLCHDYPAAGAQPQVQTTIGAEKAGNTQLNSTTSQADYIALRTRRDATLAAPRLLYPSLQVNICAGRLPAQDAQGRRFLRLPVLTQFRSRLATMLVDPAGLLAHSTKRFRRRYDFLDGETKMLEQRFRRRGGAEGIDADDMAVEADVFAPVVGDAGLDGDALAAGRQQHAVAVRLRLTVEQVGAGHRHDARGNAVFFQRALCIHCQSHFGTGGNEDRVELATVRVGKYVAAEFNRHHLRRRACLVRKILAREHQT